MALRDIRYARLDGNTNRARRTLDIRVVSCTRMDVYHVLSLTIHSFNKRIPVRPTFFIYLVVQLITQSSSSSLLDFDKGGRPW
jgi:hypothetical protein